MRNGKIAGRSVPTISNTFLAMSARSRILTMGPDWMCPRPFAIISGLAPTDVTDWQFVEVRDVPPGPWRSYGDNNHFVVARRQSEERVAAGGSGAAKK